MSTRMKIAFGCHVLAMLVVAAFGFTYLFRTEFMPYHSVAVGMPWVEVPPPFRVLIIALMKVIGSACFAVVVLELFLLFVPFRRGAVWARWAVPAGGLVIIVGSLYAMSLVGLNTPATPPWIAPAIAGLFLIAGLLLSLGRQET